MPVKEELKQCTKCLEFLPPTGKYFIKDKRLKSGLGSKCLECRKHILRNLRDLKRGSPSKEYYRMVNLSRKDKRKHYYIRVKSRDILSHKANCTMKSIRKKMRELRLQLESEINNEYLVNLFQNNLNCKCCGISLDYSSTYSSTLEGKGKRRIRMDTATIDRVDSKRGYSKKNIKIICYRCNSVKRDATVEELRSILEYMEKYSG